MQTDKTTARIVGTLFIVATATAVVGDALLRPVRDDSDYLARFAADESRVIVGVLFEVALAASVIAIAVMLFPVLKRSSEGVALGYVGARILEAVIIVLGGISSLLLLTLSDEFVAGSADGAEAETLGAVLLAAREWTDALGPAIVFALTALILNGLFYVSGIVPRWLSIWGLVGAVLILVAGVRELYGESPTSTSSVLLTLPIGVNEMVLAVWLIVKGFTSPIRTSEAASRRRS